MNHILLVEDEPKIAQLLIDYLQSNQFTTTHIDHGSLVTSWVRQHQPDLILLDLMLPGIDGMTLCKEIRTFSTIPIIMVTARIEEIDHILGLEIGADDYICKPFRPREVVARVKALLRRMHINHEPQTMDLSLQIDLDRFIAHFNDEMLDLTPIELRLLHTLSEKPGYVFARNSLLDCIYQDNRIVTHRTVDTHVKNLRKKLSSAGADADLIRSIYGVGYKWMG